MSLDVMKAVWNSPMKSHTGKLILLAIADNMRHADDYAFPSLPTLARKCSLSRRSVITQLAILESQGYLTTDRGGEKSGKVNRYRVNTVKQLPPSPGEAPSLLLVMELHPSRELDADEPVNLLHPSTREATSPLPVREVHGGGELDAGQPVKLLPEPVKQLHPNPYNRKEEPTVLSTDSGERDSPVLSSPCHPDLIREILAAYPTSRGQDKAILILRDEGDKGNDLHAILHGTRAIAAVVRETWPESDIQFIPSADLFYQNRRWQETPADWRRGRSVPRAGSADDWVGKGFINQTPEFHEQQP